MSRVLNARFYAFETRFARSCGALTKESNKFPSTRLARRGPSKLVRLLSQAHKNSLIEWEKGAFAETKQFCPHIVLKI
ncbi:MAG: hypothetical protein UY60_C0010G0010 [Parcubacteria group bacterium GW2011_GWB1_50_9]|uniref:Uncharacterized protein n=1 Tax=Candidatus Adlerbacteria bacterium GW2011_GWC1_50_9 TaxID=1618608 RepID=A0A0G1WNI2_9BACT|nr:MAG: hypothetical protein UY60_C0010G0010 [Parcubacteria group bacterium GW2011_GWB1_50_9]KKW20403.1 MAG: hypothetical protein UY61_C0035G0021 [Candidatus Adlerbacteria bacterium GW2011_GWC1_50_9]